MSLRNALVVCLLVGCSSNDFEVGSAGDSPVTDSSVEDARQTDSSSTDVAADGSTTCDPSEAPDAKGGVFVSPSGSDAGADGSALSPYKTIAAALAAAKSLGRGRLFLDAGTYDETVTVTDAASGLVIEGGWKATGAAWKRSCGDAARAETVIAGGANAVVFDGVHHRSGLRRLTAKTKAKGASVKGAPGESLVAVFVRNTDALIELTDVAVIAGDAGDGGAAPDPGPSGSPACGACAGTAVGATGANGIAGASGSAAKLPGSFSPAGFTAADGSPGAPGAPGGTGGPPGTPESGTCVTGCTGMGAGCGAFCGRVDGTKVAGSGTCGCGGAGGGGGGAGRGGGASVGVLVFGGASVDLVASLVRAGNGGNGSTGGAGRDGGAETAGSAGADVSCATDCALSAACECVGTGAKKLAGASSGGAGGFGGHGGAGGGGGGGPSYAVVNIGGTVKTSTTKLEHGGGGAGASGGVIGTAGDSFP